MKSENWLYLAVALVGFVASGACNGDDDDPHTCDTGAGGSAVKSCDLGGDCDSCMASACAKEVCQDDISACDANPNCDKFGKCMDACSIDPDPATCTGDCGMKYMDGIQDFGNMLSCLVCNQEACYGDCNGKQNCGAGGGVVGGGPPTGGGSPTGGSTAAGGMSAGGMSAGGMSAGGMSAGGGGQGGSS